MGLELSEHSRMGRFIVVTITNRCDKVKYLALSQMKTKPPNSNPVVGCVALSCGVCPFLTSELSMRFMYLSEISFYWSGCHILDFLKGTGKSDNVSY